MTDKDDKDDKDDKTPSDDAAAVSKLKSLFNEVLDEREAKAAAVKEQADKDDKAPEEKRTTPKRTFFQELFGG